jgi:hypothetical protein
LAAKRSAIAPRTIAEAIEATATATRPLARSATADTADTTARPACAAKAIALISPVGPAGINRSREVDTALRQERHRIVT